jgi:hypothetical protein
MKYAAIFNGILEVQNPAQNGKNLAGIGAFETHGFAFTMAALTMIRPYAKRTIF